MERSLAQSNHLAPLLVDVLQELRQAHDRVRSLEADIESYQLLSHQAIHALHDVVGERDRLRAQLRDLRDEYRALRERALFTVGAVA